MYPNLTDHFKNEINFDFLLEMKKTSTHILGLTIGGGTSLAIIIIIVLLFIRKWNTKVSFIFFFMLRFLETPYDNKEQNNVKCSLFIDSVI